MAIYGSLHVGMFFREHVVTDDQGFSYRGTHHRWSDVEDVKVEEAAAFPLKPLPRVARCFVRVKSGAVVEFSAKSLQKRGAAISAGYATAFDELAAIFRAKSRHNKLLQPIMREDARSG